MAVLGSVLKSSWRPQVYLIFEQQATWFEEWEFGFWIDLALWWSFLEHWALLFWDFFGVRLFPYPTAINGFDLSPTP